MDVLSYGRIAERIIVAGCVPLLLVLAYKLFVLGATGKMTLTTRWGKVTNASPGIICFGLAILLGICVLRAQLSWRANDLPEGRAARPSDPTLSPSTAPKPPYRPEHVDYGI